MLALLASYYVVAYLIIPGTIFQGISSLKLQIKEFRRTKTEEITYSAIASILPFLFAILFTWCIWPATIFPHRSNESVQQRRADYKLVFHVASSNNAPGTDSPEFWSAINRVMRRQIRFLFWYWLFVVIASYWFAQFVSKYGKYSVNSLRRRVADLFLRSVSEWYVLMEPLTNPAPENIEVWADVLTSRNILYRGLVADYWLDKDGNLLGLLLDNPERFDRDDYVQKLAGRHLMPEEKSRIKDAHWRPIPSANLYLPYGQMQNLNIRHKPKNVAVATTSVLRLEKTPFEITDAAPDSSVDWTVLDSIAAAEENESGMAKDSKEPNRSKLDTGGEIQSQ